MINLKLTEKDKKAMEKKYSIGPDNNKYPYGSAIRFEDEIIQKSPELQALKGGKEINLNCSAFVKDIRYREDEKGKKIFECIEIQITKIDIDGANTAKEAFEED